jgi:hypothetical protein
MQEGGRLNQFRLELACDCFLSNDFSFPQNSVDV